MRLTLQLAARHGVAAGRFDRARRTPQAPAGPVHVATYVEVVRGSAKDGAKLLAQYRDASRKENGNMRAEVAHEIGRPNRFVVLETWKDQAAFDAHGKSAGTAAFRDKLKAIHAGPYDERMHNSLNVGPNDAPARKGAVIVVTMSTCRRRARTSASRRSIRSPRRAARAAATSASRCSSSRAARTTSPWWRPGRTRRPMTRSRSADAQRQFRDKLGPMLGALYDERLYR